MAVTGASRCLRWGLSGIVMLAVTNVPAAAPVRCDRQCLETIAKAYWSVLLNHDLARLPQASQIRFTENDVPLMTGRGVWQTISSAGPQDIVFVDESEGEVATTAQIYEGQRPALLIARLKVVDGQVLELETVVGRRETTNFLRPEGWHQEHALLMHPLEAAAQRSRDELIGIADGYFNRLPDPSRPLPSLDRQCNRVENGLRTTNNPDPFPGIDPPPLNPAVSRLGCAEQFSSSCLSFVSRVRARRYPLVDVRKGVVLALVMFDHDGTAPAGSASASKLSATLPSPYSYMVAEVFKIEAGRIIQIHALFCILPYGMATSWPQ